MIVATSIVAALVVCYLLARERFDVALCGWSL